MMKNSNRYTYEHITETPAMDCNHNVPLISDYLFNRYFFKTEYSEEWHENGNRIYVPFYNSCLCGIWPIPHTGNLMGWYTMRVG